MIKSQAQFNLLQKESIFIVVSDPLTKEPLELFVSDGDEEKNQNLNNEKGLVLSDLVRSEKAQQILRQNSIVNDNLNTTISPEWIKIIREKLPQKLKNMEENISRLLLTR
jgi:hypothetical protein